MSVYANWYLPSNKKSKTQYYQEQPSTRALKQKI